MKSQQNMLDSLDLEIEFWEEAIARYSGEDTAVLERLQHALALAEKRRAACLSRINPGVSQVS